MPLSAIYPHHFGIAVQHVLDWTQRAVDNRALQETAALFAAGLPTVEEAYAAAVRDGSRCHFNDRDPGWRGMRAELPPKKTIVQRKLLFQRKRDVAGAEGVVIEVDSSDDEQIRTETSAGSCLEWFTGAFPSGFELAVSATHVVLKQVSEQHLAAQAIISKKTAPMVLQQQRREVPWMALRSAGVHTRNVSFRASQSGDVLLRAGQVRWKPLMAGI